MSEDNSKEEITEKIKIIATDDEKIKSFGELLTNDSSRAILQLLFNEELTALQISEKTGISLQLVKYHIIKLQPNLPFELSFLFVYQTLPEQNFPMHV